MDPRVLVLEPGNQLLPIDGARPNGALGPAYLVGALRREGIDTDYLDATVGRTVDDLPRSFYNRVEQENGTIRYGMSLEDLAEIFAKYDVIATSSIFSAQTRMHFEVAGLARKVASQRGVGSSWYPVEWNARALRRHFLANGFDIVGLGDGEQTIVEVVKEFARSDCDFSRVSGIAWVQHGQLIDQPVRESVTRSHRRPPVSRFRCLTA